MKITIVTSGQPSTNPRAVKEADALTENGHEVTFIYQHRNQWASSSDAQLLQNKKWQAKLVGGSPDYQPFLYLITRIRHGILKKSASFLGFKKCMSEWLVDRCVFELKRECLKAKADLYIAHNLAALPAAVYAAKKKNAKCGFDAEDFHRHETSDDVNSIDVKLKSYFEDKYIVTLDYLTTASPLISLAYKRLYPKISPITILNVFEKKTFEVHNSDSNSLKLFWFSQTIGKGRGIEDIIKAISILNNPQIKLTLLGNIDDYNRNYFESLIKSLGVLKEQIEFLPPVNADLIFDIANKCDIGIASEFNKPLNRDIALSNKLFTYLIAGIAVVSTETSAQQKFMSAHPDIGRSYPIGDAFALSEILLHYSLNRDVLNTTKEKAHGLATKKYNWENEKEKFTKIINSLNKN